VIPAKRVRWAPIISALLALPTLAEAKSLLIMKLEPGTLDAELVKVLDDAVRVGARKAKKGKVLPAPALDFAGMQLAAGCLDEGTECISAIGKTIGAERVLRVVPSGAAARLTLEFTLVEVKTAKASAYEAKLEEVTAESRVEVEWHAMIALGAKPPPLEGRIALLMGTSIGSLEGAELFLDDKKVPRSSLDSVPAGWHRLEVHQQGFETFIWQETVKAGRVVEVRVAFTPRTVAEAPPPPPPSVDLAPAPPPPPAAVVATTPDVGSPIVYTFVLGGAAIASGIAGTVLAAMGQMAENRLHDRAMNRAAEYVECVTGAAPSSLDLCREIEKDSDLLKPAQYGSWVSFAAAGAFAIGAVVAFFFEWDSGEREVTVGLLPGPNEANATLSVRF
jgi:hypothetical protein